MKSYFSKISFSFMEMSTKPSSCILHRKINCVFKCEVWWLAASQLQLDLNIQSATKDHPRMMQLLLHHRGMEITQAQVSSKGEKSLVTVLGRGRVFTCLIQSVSDPWVCCTCLIQSVSDTWVCCTCLIQSVSDTWVCYGQVVRCCFHWRQPRTTWRTRRPASLASSALSLATNGTPKLRMWEQCFMIFCSVMYKPCCRVLEREMVWWKQGRSYSIL